MKSFVLLALSLAAPAAFADEAFSNLDPAPNMYSGTNVRVIGIGSFKPNLIQGTQFVSAATGVVSSISLAINNYQSNLGQHDPYKLSLYTDSGTDRLGTLLGSYSGQSTGKIWFGTTDALSVVDAGSTSVSLTAGTKYWLVAEGVGNSSLSWNVSNRTTPMNGFTSSNGDDAYGSSTFTNAFAVQVNPVPEPASMAALAVGAAAMIRRRRK